MNCMCWQRPQDTAESSGKKTVGEHDFIWKWPCRLIHFTSQLVIICTDMSRSLQNIHYSAFTSVFCSELHSLTLSLLQVVSQSLVLTQESDHSGNKNNKVTEQAAQKHHRHECVWSKWDLLYFCSQDCSVFFIWTWLKLSSHCRLFTSCKTSRLAYLSSFTASIHTHKVRYIRWFSTQPHEFLASDLQTWFHKWHNPD